MVIGVHRIGLIYTGQMHQRVNRSPRAFDRHGTACRCFQVRFQRGQPDPAQLRPRLGQPPRVAVHDHDMTAAFHEGMRGLDADAPGPAGDDDPLAREINHRHCIPKVSWAIAIRARR